MSLNVKELDDIISELTNLDGAMCKLNENLIRSLCATAKEDFSRQPMLLELSAPVHICGDTHGQFQDLMRLFASCGHPPKSNYLFLGDYVDRGKQSLETICLLFAYRVRYPKNFFLLRGNHECAGVNQIYGFFDEVKRRHNIKLWRCFVDCFDYMPVAAIVSRRIFCCHGGLSPDLRNMQQIRQLPRPTDVPMHGLMCDLLWADLNHVSEGWGHNERGISVTYSKNIINQFLKEHDFDLICRAHEVVEDGYEFYANRKLVTIFSAPNYCGQMNNSGAVLKVNHNLVCSFVIIRPSLHIMNCAFIAKANYALPTII